MTYYLWPKNAGLIAASLLFLIYYCTSANYLADGDSGEFAFLALNRTIAHPPGYPFYSSILVGLGQLTGSLFLHTLFSGLCVSLAIALQFKTWEIAVSRIGLFVACMLAGLSQPIWQIATSTEPFGLNLLLCSAVIYFQVGILRDAKEKQQLWRRSLALGILFGLGFCNHHTLVLLAPGTLVAFFYSPLARKSLMSSARFFFLGFLLGLLPITYFLFADTTNVYSWGDWTQFWPQLIHHMTRSDYGTFALSANTKGAFFWRPLWYYLTRLPNYFGICFLAGIVPALIHLKNSPKLPAKGHTQMLALVICNIVFTNIFFTFKLGDAVEGPDSIVLQRFFALNLLVLIPPCAFLLNRWFEFFASRIFRTTSLLFIVVFSFLLHLNESNRRSHHLIADYFFNIAQGLPDQSVLMTSSDFDFHGMIYYLNKNLPEKKVLVIHPLGWGFDFYRQKIIKFTGYPQLEDSNFSNFFEWIIATKPVYLTELGFRQLAPFLPFANFSCPIAKISPLNSPTVSFAGQLEESRKVDDDLRYPTSQAIKNATEWELQALRVWRTCWEKFAITSNLADREPIKKNLLRLKF